MAQPTTEERTLFSRLRNTLSLSSISNLRQRQRQSATGTTFKPRSDDEVLARIIGDQVTASIKRDIPAYLKAFAELPWLRTSITKVANQISANDWEILIVTEAINDKTGEIIVVKESPKERIPLQDFINDPNPSFSFSQLIWLTQVYLELVGEAFWWIVPIAGVLKAYPIAPNKVVRTPTPDEPYFTCSGPKGQFTIAIDEVIWFAHPDPADPYSRGVGLAQSLSHDLDTDDAASRYVLSFFNNNARPPLLIYGEGLNAERVRQLEDDWNQQHQGFWNAGKARFLSRKVEIKELSQKFEGTDIVNLRQHERDIIASVIGVPPEILGVLSASNRATIDAADHFFSKYTIKPRLDFLQEIINKQLIPRFDETGNVVMIFINPVMKDKEIILKAARYMPSALMIDEWRELMEYPPLENEGGQVFVVPMNVNVLGNLKGAGIPAAEPQPTSEPKAAGEEAYGSVETLFGTLKGRKVRSFKELIK